LGHFPSCFGDEIIGFLMPRVSVIIPTYNRPALLRETLRSVSNQTFTDFEIIVVDDGSTVPGVEDVCAEFLECRYFRQENMGRSSARNRGIGEARGELIAFVDDDDLWKPEKLARQVAFLDQNPHIGLVHSPVEKILFDGTPTGELIGNNSPQLRSGRVFPYAVRICVVKSPTPLVRREIFTHCGSFDPNLNAGEDWEFWARVSYKYNFGFIAEPLAYYRIQKARTTVGDEYLRNSNYIEKKLAAYVDEKDRRIVHKEVCFAYIREIRLHTRPLSLKRFSHLCMAWALYPSSCGWKMFWGTLLIGKR
jgi:glycosyltransferase involved in cell wall biosynthesis